MKDYFKYKEENESSKEWLKTKCFVIIVFSSVTVYKIATTPIDIVVDFPTLLSLLLAFFSVGLAALFYFKATETSNTFYDNTIKFTQEIASLLVKIESGFGEKLRHLDEGYTSMRDKIDGIPNNYDIEDTKAEIQKEQEELKKKLKEKDKMVEDLATKAHLDDEAKKKFKGQLENYIEEYNAAKKEISFLNSRLRHAEYLTSQEESQVSDDSDILNYIVERLLPLISPELIAEGSKSAINKRFQRVKGKLPKSFIKDLTHNGFLTPQGTISGRGASILKEIVNEYYRPNKTLQGTSRQRGFSKF